MNKQERVAVVTGGASGIGHAFAQALADDGYRVAIWDLRGSAQAAKKLQSGGHEALGLDTDVVSAPAVAASAEETLARLGGIDVLVNNAGLFSTLALKPFEQIEDAEWMKVMEVNTLGPFVCAKAAVPALRRSKAGRIVNVASIVPMKAPPNMAHYVASKGAVIAFTRALARELGPNQITVNAIAPGFTLSDGVVDNDLHNRIGANARTESRCIRRDQVPADLVGALRFLASDAAQFVTGQTLAVDGGSVFL